jgi:hypothetical protein
MECLSASLDYWQKITISGMLKWKLVLAAFG